MATKLDCLLEEIDPCRTLDSLERRVNDAVSSFRGSSAPVNSMAEFRQLGADFYSHVLSGVLCLRPAQDLGAEIGFGEFARLVTTVYGELSAAYAFAHSGTGGGLAGVLRAVARQMVVVHSKNRIKAAVSKFWHSLSSEEILAAADEYVRKYAHLWPPEVAGSNGHLLKARFAEILAEHPFMIRRLKEMGW